MFERIDRDIHGRPVKVHVWSEEDKRLPWKDRPWPKVGILVMKSEEEDKECKELLHGEGWFKDCFEDIVKILSWAYYEFPLYHTPVPHTVGAEILVRPGTSIEELMDIPIDKTLIMKAIKIDGEIVVSLKQVRERERT